MSNAENLAKLALEWIGAKQSLTPSGYQKFPSGLVLQWGATPSILSGQSAVITYPIPFPNGAFVAVASGGSTVNTATPGALTVDLTNPGTASQFTVRNWGSIGIGIGCWIALGS